MNTRFYRTQKIKASLAIIGAGVFLATFYPFINGETIGSILNGFVIGLVGSIFIALNEIILNFKTIRRMRFWAVVVYKTILYVTFFTISIPLIVSIGRSLQAGINLQTFVQQGGLHHFLFEEDFHIIMAYSLFSTLIFIFTYQMSKKMGQGVFFSFVFGKYHRPRERELIFMFLDLNKSTTIAEKMGDMKFNNLLKDFFLDITDSILMHGGNIYRYVGDEVVVSWSMNKGIDNARVIRTFFHAQEAVLENKQNYLDKYGLFPTFTASFDYGKVVVGEIGNIKSQISFFGNVLYETAEIEKQCANCKSELLIADRLLNKIKLPDGLLPKKVGVIETSLGSKIEISSVLKKTA